jgi:membrane-associated phospholipid phosphatase
MGGILDPHAQRSPNETPTTFLRLMDRWFLLGAYGRQTRFHMAAAWLTLGSIVAVDVVWLLLSDLSFAEDNWGSIVRLVLFSAMAFGLCGLVSYRLAGATDRIGCLLREVGNRVELFVVAMLAFGLLAVAIIAYCYLATAAALPLQDALLARMDRSLGFDWVGFVKFANSSALLSWLLVESYRSTPYMLVGTVLCLCISGQSRRLAELLALMCLTFVGIAVGTLMLPAEGAYAYHNPSIADYYNFGSGSGMWHHQLLTAIRSGATRVIDFNTPNSNCLITFPSGHTVLAIITTYALRSSRWTLVPALLVNGMMLVSTIPHGGHYLVDVIAGAAIAACAIAAVRLPVDMRSSRFMADSALIIENA